MYLEYESLLTPLILLNFSLNIKEELLFQFLNMCALSEKITAIPNQIESRNKKINALKKKSHELPYCHSLDKMKCFV